MAINFEDNSHPSRPAVARPFLRWAGSKRLLLGELYQVVPSQFGRYFEPFLGGGSLFFHLQPARATLSDVCRELIETYEGLRDNPSLVWKYISPLKPDRKAFYRIRERRSRGKYQKTAEFIYLNKTCWNGLYRVNSSGVFNVPFGQPKSEGIAERSNLNACAAALGQFGVKLICADFEDVVDAAGCGDFVYFDPPYVTGHENNGFIDYNEKLFSWDDQKRLASVAAKLAKKGVRVVVSNADHPAILKLYSTFSVRRVYRSSTIASSSVHRSRRSELIFTGP